MPDLPAAFGGRYQPLDLLGSGATAPVWRVRDLVDGRVLALKSVSDTALAHNEWRASRALRHPSLVRAHDLGHLPDGSWFLVSELAPGRPLLEWWKPKDWAGLMAAAAQVADALEALHRLGLLHLDLKPDNIRVDGSGPTVRACLLDLGFAQASATISHELNGTPAYTSPERADPGPARPEADFFSLGASLYHTLSGRPPHGNDRKHSILARARTADHEPLREVPEPIAALVEELLSPNPLRRPRSGVADRLGALATEFDPSARPWPRGREWSSQRCVGREAPLLEVRSAMKPDDGPPPGALWIEATAGEGRSTFLTTVADELRATGRAVLEIPGAELEAELLPALERWLGQTPTKPDTQAIAPSLYTVAARREARATRGAAALEKLTRELGCPPVLVIDDADEARAEIEALLGANPRVEPASIGIVAVISPAATKGSPLPGQHLRLPLPTVDLSNAILGECAPAHRFQDDLVEWVHQSTGGHPSRVASVGRALATVEISGRTTQELQSLVSSLASGTDTAARQRLQALESELQEILESCVLLSSYASIETISRLLSLAPDHVEALVDQLRSRGLLRELAAGRFEISNASLRAAVEEELGPARSARLHRRALMNLEKTTDSDTPDESSPSCPDPDQLAHHRLGAGRGVEALPPLLEAIQAALRAGRGGEALRWAVRGLEALNSTHPERTRLHCRAAQGALLQANREAVRHHAGMAWRTALPDLPVANHGLPAPESLAAIPVPKKPLAEPPSNPDQLQDGWEALILDCGARCDGGDEVDTLPVISAIRDRLDENPELRGLAQQADEVVATAMVHSGSILEAIPYLQRVISGGREPLARARFLGILGGALGQAGRLEEGRAAIEEATELGARIGAAPLVMRVTFHEAELLFETGEFDLAQGKCQQVLEWATARDHTELTILAQQRLGRVAAVRGRFDDAVEIYDRALPAAQRLGLTLPLLQHHTSRAYALERLGRLPEAIADQEAAAALALASGRRLEEAWLQGNRAHNLIRLGRLDDAGKILDGARRTTDHLGTQRDRLQVVKATVQLNLHLRRWDELEHSIDLGLAIDAEVPGGTGNRGELLGRRVQAACARRQGPEARQRLEEARGPIQAAADPGSQAFLHLLEAEVLLLEHRPSQAAAQARTAFAMADLLGDQLRGWALATLGRIDHARGHLQRARSQLQEAVGILDGLMLRQWIEASVEIGLLRAAAGEPDAASCITPIEEHLQADQGGEALAAYLADMRSQMQDRQRSATLTLSDPGTSARLLELIESLLEHRDRDSLLAEVIDVTLELVGGERGILFRVDETTGALVPRETRGVDPSSEPDAATWSEGVLARSQRGEPIFHDDASNAEELSGFESIVRYGIRSVVAVPLIVDSRALGVIYVDNRREPLRMNANRQELLSTAARVLARLVLRAEREGALADEAALLRDEVQLTRETEAGLGRAETADRVHYGRLVGGSPPMLALYARLDSILEGSKRTGRLPRVLISGESGTGKELVALEIRDRCERSNQSYRAVNCAAFSPALLESALFGHCRGAFTGAESDRAGIFEDAHGGILFLDEIGEASLELQAKLLRAVEQGEIRRLGESGTRQVDVWLIAASNRDLAAEVENGRFRRDLLYRIRQIEVRLPPLRARPGDIESLARHLLARESRGAPTPRLTTGAIRELSAHPWPYNVRQLEATITEALMLARDGQIGPDQLPDDIRNQASGKADPDDRPLTLDDRIAALIRREIRAALETQGGNRTRAAQALGISDKKLRDWIRRYRVPVVRAKTGRPHDSPHSI